MAFDTGFLVWLQQYRAMVPDSINQLMSQASSLTYYALIIVVVAAILWWKGGKKSEYAVVAFAIAHAIYLVLCLTLDVPRPWELDPNVIPMSRSPGLSCPSGHMAIVTSVFGALAYIMRKKIVTVLSVIIIAFVGIQRMYVGVHTPIDILFGVAVGLAALVIAVYMLDWAGDDRKGAYWVFAVTLLIMIISVLYADSQPSVYVDGKFVFDKLDQRVYLAQMELTMLAMIIGVAVNRYTDAFAIPNTGRNSMVAGSVIGAAVILAILYGMKYLLAFDKTFYSANWLPGVISVLFAFFVYPLIWRYAIGYRRDVPAV